MEEIDALEAVSHLAKARTKGGELMFTLCAMEHVLSECAVCGIAILGIELFSESADSYRWIGFSTYEVARQSLSWHDFVMANNVLAAEFISRNSAEDDQFYLLTAITKSESESRFGATQTIS